MPSERITKHETTPGKCDRLETDTGEVVWVMMRDRRVDAVGKDGRLRVRHVFKLVIAIAVSLFAGVIGSLFTAPAIPVWYADLVKPALNPPT